MDRISLYICGMSREMQQWLKTIVTDVKVISTSFRGKPAILINFAMPGVARACLMNFGFIHM